MKYIIKNMKNSPFKGIDYSYVTSDYGKRRFWNQFTNRFDSNFHNGIDLISGDIIVSIMDGNVIACRNDIDGYTEKFSLGNYVTVKHDGNIKTIYAHMKKGSVKVKVGDYVKKGDVLGTKGSTGYSVSPHLHFAVKVNNKYVNPKSFLITDNEAKSVSETKSISELKYVVKKGDNLSKIAKKYNTTWKSIYNKNKSMIGSNPNLIKPGMVIYI